MRTVNEKELKELSLTPVDSIVAKWGEILKDTKDQALVCVVSEETAGLGYLLGLSTKDKSGYQSLGMVLEEHNYEIAKGWVEEANKIIFKRDEKETFMIVISSMRR